MRILVTGKNGQVGYELSRSLACFGDIIATDSKTLNLSELSTLEDKVLSLKPDLIVNAAAYTAVDKAETEQELAYKVNAQGPEILAKIAKKLDIPLVHYSTDYVFDGGSESAWKENDTPNPMSVYGRSKLLGEEAIVKNTDKYLILRTSWVYDARGANFLNTMKRLAIDKVQLSIVNDQSGAPTWSRHIADATAQIIGQSLLTKNNDEFWHKHSGIYHLSGAGKASWFDFAEAIFSLMEEQGKTIPKIIPIPTRDYPTPAARPTNSVLDNTKLFEHFGICLPEWKTTLKWVMTE
ncbi:hypothetical protein LCGC14_1055770 [marine sediment metagenome]|uniref:RmlD-like substrate binding domain-containing protein n=1 Tax=marine sediment metagenome TaxID=412755 RepID=A0A0F9N9F1_9ZZZZ